MYEYNVTIVKAILQLLKKPEDNLQFGEGRPGEDARYSLDSTKIRNELGWIQKTSFEQGLKKTIQWYNENHSVLENLSENALSSTPWKEPT